MAAKRKNRAANQHFGRVIEFRHSLTPETDRGCAIAAAAFLDEELKTLLASVLADEPKLLKEMFSHNGPLANFSSRIDFAMLMGLLSRVTWHDLHIIRRIRNDFAHSPHPLSFDDGAIRSRCGELRHTIRGHEAQSRQHFTSAVCAVLAFIHASLFEAKRLVVPPDLLLPEKVKAEAREEADKMVYEIQRLLRDKSVA